MASLSRHFLLVVAVLFLNGCSGLFYQPNSIRYLDPSKLGAKWQDLSFPRPGGGNLTAALIEKADQNSSKGLIIQFHGNAQNMTAHWMNLLWATQRGWKVLAWDYSGYGASDGVASQVQVAKDADAFLNWVSDSILPHQHGPVVLIGQSLGSAILLQAFPQWKDRDKATLVVSESGFPSYRTMARNVVGRYWLTWILYPFVPLLVSDAASPAPMIPKVAPTPMVIVSCAQDQVVPPAMQKGIFELAPGARFWDIQGCRHLGAMRADSVRTRLESLIDSLDLSHKP